MKKAKKDENTKHYTKTRASFLRDRLDSRCSAALFRKYVNELHRLENVIRSGEPGRSSPRPDVYDRMLKSRKGESVIAPRPKLMAAGLVDLWAPPTATELEDSRMHLAESFIGEKVEGRYHGSSHGQLAHASANTHTALEKKLQMAVSTPGLHNDGDLEKYMEEKYKLDNYMAAKAEKELLAASGSATPISQGTAEKPEEGKKSPAKKKEFSYKMPSPKHFHKISVRQPLMMQNMTVYRGGKKEQSKTNIADDGVADSGADLFQSLVAVVNLFRGKSRMQIDMLMKDFIKHARIEGATGDGQDVSIGPQGFRNWMGSCQVHDMFLVDRLYKAADVSKDGEVSFIEFRRAVHRLRGTLEQRLEMYVRIFDSSGIGSLDVADVSKLIAMGMPSASPAEIGEYVEVLFEKIDADGSGSLTFQEILEGIGDYPKLRDQLERTVI